MTCMTWSCSAAAIAPLRSYHLRATRKRIHLGSSLRLAVGWVWEVYHIPEIQKCFFLGLPESDWVSFFELHEYWNGFLPTSTDWEDLRSRSAVPSFGSLPWRQDDRCRGMGHHEGVARDHQRGDQPALALLHSNPGGPRHRPRQESTALVCADYCALEEMWMIWITPRSSLSGW